MTKTRDEDGLLMLDRFQGDIKKRRNEQGEFFDDVYSKGSHQKIKGTRAINLIMHFWSRIKAKWKSYGNESQICYEYYCGWIEQKKPEVVLDLGCGRGRAYQLKVARNCKQYIGIDIASEAVKQFQEILKDSGLSNAEVKFMDFMNNDFSDNTFDMITASGVLHHFKDVDRVCREMVRVLKPGGFVVSLDPLNTSLFMRLLRLMYRPFQTNKAWEWPFTKKTFKVFEKYFEIEQIRGSAGMSNLGFFLSFFPGCQPLAKRLFGFGRRYDNTNAVRKGPALWRCLRVTMLLKSRRKA